MKSLNSIKRLKEIENTNQSLLEIISEIKKEVSKNYEENLKIILEKISDDYELDLDELESKYIQKSKKQKKENQKIMI